MYLHDRCNQNVKRVVILCQLRHSAGLRITMTILLSSFLLTYLFTPREVKLNVLFFRYWEVFIRQDFVAAEARSLKLYYCLGWLYGWKAPLIFADHFLNFLLYPLPGVLHTLFYLIQHTWVSAFFDVTPSPWLSLTLKPLRFTANIILDLLAIRFSWAFIVGLRKDLTMLYVPVRWH